MVKRQPHRHREICDHRVTHGHRVTHPPQSQGHPWSQDTLYHKGTQGHPDIGTPRDTLPALKLCAEPPLHTHFSGVSSSLARSLWPRASSSGTLSSQVCLAPLWCHSLKPLRPETGVVLVSVQVNSSQRDIGPCPRSHSS